MGIIQNLNEIVLSVIKITTQHYVVLFAVHVHVFYEYGASVQVETVDKVFVIELA